jgi:flagellar export protein FliJ
MAELRFRLKSLLKLREAARDERRARLAEALAADEKLAERRNTLLSEIEASEKLQRGTLGAIDVDRLLARHRYELTLKAEASSLDAQRAALEPEIEKRREALVAADRELRILEKLRDKLAERATQVQRAAEAKELDEVAARQWRQGEA